LSNLIKSMKSALGLLVSALTAVVLLLGSGPGYGFDFFQPIVPPRRVQFVAEGGARRQAPANTWPALAHVIEDHFAWAAVAVRVTRNGRHVLFSDPLLQRASSGHGKLVEYDWNALRELDAGAWFAPRFRRVRILSLEQVLQRAHGKINLCLDCKQVIPAKLVHDIIATKMERQVIVLDTLETCRTIRRLSSGRVAVMVRWRPEHGLEDWLDAFRPDAVQILAKDVTAARCAAFRARKVRIQVLATGASDHVKTWDRVVSRGADWLRTDLPEEAYAHQLWQRIQHRPVRIAMHRGAARYAPENTIPAFLKAIRLGADFVEFDVRTTRDARQFLMHDRDLDRTTNGRGPLSAATAKSLASRDAGTWFGPAWKGTPVPTLEQLLDAVRGKVGLYVDAKDVAPEVLARQLDKYHMVNESITYGAPFMLARLKRLRPGIRVLAPLPSNHLLPVYAATLKPYAVDATWSDLSAAFITRCHGDAMKVFADAPDDTTVADYQRAIRWGIDLIQTDQPMRLLRAIELIEAVRPTPAKDPHGIHAGGSSAARDHP